MEDIRELLRVMAALRDPDTGCPWDLAQDFASIVPHTIEEAYEVAEAAERGEMRALCDELGDLLLQVVFCSQIAAERGVFDFEAVVSALVEKLVRRHPHVFADTVYSDLQEQTEAWEQIKNRERSVAGEAHESVLDGVPPALPALTRARKLQQRAARLGLDWPALAPVAAKVGEELAELRSALAARPSSGSTAAERGDLLVSCANLARWLALDPEQVLRAANRRFERRVRHVEQALAQRQSLGDQPDPQTLDRLWEDAKRVSCEPED